MRKSCESMRKRAKCLKVWGSAQNIEKVWESMQNVEKEWESMHII